MIRPADRCRIFRELHGSGCFVIPNPWDIGSARLLEQLGFRALATTSSGIAWSLGRPDNHVPVEATLARLREISQSVEIPINADFEGGFATDPEAVAANVAAATATGIAGLSIEDSTGDVSNPLHDFSLAVERIRAARRAIDDSAAGIVLTARSEGFIVGRPDLGETIRRLTAFAEAGADCLYAPGPRGLDRFPGGGEGNLRAGDFHRRLPRHSVFRDQSVIRPRVMDRPGGRLSGMVMLGCRGS